MINTGGKSVCESLRHWSLLDHVRMEQELEALLGRKVDL